MENFKDIDDSHLFNRYEMRVLQGTDGRKDIIISCWNDESAVKMKVLGDGITASSIKNFNKAEIEFSISGKSTVTSQGMQEYIKDIQDAETAAAYFKGVLSTY